MSRPRHLTAAIVIVLLAGLLVPATATVGGAPTAIDRHPTHPAPRFAADADAGSPVLLRDAPSVGTSVHLIDGHAGQSPIDVGSHPAVGQGVDLPSLAEVGPSGWLLLAGYSRYDDSDPLDNGARRRIYEAVTRSPGTYASELAETTSFSRSTVRYHVRILEEEGLIASEKLRGKRRYVPRETSDVELTAALEDDASRAVLTAVRRTEPATVTELARELDRAPSTTSYHLSRLSDAGLIEQAREDGAVVNCLAPKTEVELTRRSADGTAADVSATSGD